MHVMSVMAATDELGWLLMQPANAELPENFKVPVGWMDHSLQLSKLKTPKVQSTYVPSFGGWG
jgi:hypothetical protein